MRVLRIGMTYPRDCKPGIGQHLYYHSLLSNYDECIITAKREGIMPDNRKGVKIIEIEYEDSPLGVYTDSKLKRFTSAVKKSVGLYMFFLKSKQPIKEFHPDLVHVYSPMPILCAIYARKKYNSKIVMSLHGSDALRINKVPVLSNVLSIPDAVVTVGDNMEELLTNKKLKRPIDCIGNGVDLSVFYNKHMERKKQFIHVANLRWQKGQEYLINGFSQFLKVYPDYRLVIIGDGEQRERLETLCKELRINDNVVFMGTKGRELIANELNQSKAFVLTSVTEGFPKVIIEAMATGTPVISSDVGNIRKVVDDSGIIFPAKDDKAVFSAMKEIVETSQYEIMSQKAEEYSKQYSWEAHIDRLENVYEEVINNGQ